MKQKKIKERKYKIRRMDLRLTEDDYNKIQALANRLTNGNVTKLVLNAVLDRPIRVVEVSESDCRMLDYVKKIMSVYRNIGINYNQVVKNINTFRNATDVVQEMTALRDKTEKLIRLTAALNDFFKNLSNGNQDQ